MNWNTRDLTAINALCKNTLMEHLRMHFHVIDDQGIGAQMEVGAQVHQPMGLLHGGASVALIESIGSMGSALLCDLSVESPVGLEVNANHIQGIKSGRVNGYGTLLHKGKRTHVWKVDVTDADTGKLISTGRITIMIVARNHGG